MDGTAANAAEAAAAGLVIGTLAADTEGSAAGGKTIIRSRGTGFCFGGTAVKKACSCRASLFDNAVIMNPVFLFCLLSCFFFLVSAVLRLQLRLSAVSKLLL